MSKVKKKVTADKLQQVYDHIAPDWYGLRHHSRFTTELTELAKRWQHGRLLNLGCGQGADFQPFKNGFELNGVDFSPEMIKQAHRYAQKFSFEAKLTVADAGSLPYSDDSFDWAIAVAIYHHIEDGRARLAALKELRRVLKPGGQAFITVWNRWQPRFWFSRCEVMVPWLQRGEFLHRYYHLFSYPELEKLIAEAGFRVIKSYPESGYRFPIKTFSRNICILAEK
jgi:ubiquinone/menaquinone biosynthesis C-methylase UbiE